MGQHCYMALESKLLRAILVILVGKLLSYSECHGFEYYTLLYRVIV